MRDRLISPPTMPHKHSRTTMTASAAARLVWAGALLGLLWAAVWWAVR